MYNIDPDPPSHLEADPDSTFHFDAVLDSTFFHCPLWLYYEPTQLQKFFIYFFGGLECVGLSFAYAAHFVFLGDVWI
jgi:hypothetical protein